MDLYAQRSEISTGTPVIIYAFYRTIWTYSITFVYAKEALARL